MEKEESKVSKKSNWGYKAIIWFLSHVPPFSAYHVIFNSKNVAGSTKIGLAIMILASAILVWHLDLI